MLSAKSLGVGKQIPLNPDMEAIKAEITDMTNIKSVTGGFFSYNKYFGFFNGSMIMKAKNYSQGDNICQLPVNPKFSNCYVLGLLSGELVGLYINSTGMLKANQSMNANDGAYLQINGSFPITVGGGVIDSLLRKFMTFFSRKEVMNYA